MTAIDHAEISVKKPRIAGVAQLVEHPICNRAVGSSSLSASTIRLDLVTHSRRRSSDDKSKASYHLKW